MADANRKVQIDIKTTADASGAKTAADAIRELAAAEKAASDASWAAAGAANNITKNLEEEQRAANLLLLSQQRLVQAQNEANARISEEQAIRDKAVGGFKNLGAAIGQVIRNGLAVLGVEAVETM